MGLEAKCKAHYAAQISEGKALLESDELIFRGEFRFVIPLKQITEIGASDGNLRVVFPEGAALFELGAQAEKWAERIRHPKSLLDKLGVKPDSQVGLVNWEDVDFNEQLHALLGKSARLTFRQDLDLLFYQANTKDDLKQLKGLRKGIKQDGGLWVVYAKGKLQLNENDVREAAKKQGLVDVKVASYSATHSALKLVIPVAERKR